MNRSDPVVTRRRLAAAAGAVLALLVLAVTAAGQARREEVLVSAAASLSEVMADIARGFEAGDGARVVLNLGASNALVRQVLAGAPVDVFVSADDQQISQLGVAARPGSRVELASNQLAIIVPDDRPAAWTSVRTLLDTAVRRVAIGDPAGVPAGVYARQYLTRIGLWSALQPKLVPSGSVRLALAAVEAGSVDAAIVYRTDAAVAKRSKVAWLVPTAEGPVIRYAAVGLRESPNPTAADRFLRYLGSADAAAVLRRAGFLPPAAARSR